MDFFLQASKALIFSSEQKATNKVGIFSGPIEGNSAQFISNLYGTLISIAFAFLGTYILLRIIKLFMKVDVSLPEENASLDRALHGEEAYDF